MKEIEDQIKRLEQKLCYADFISDLFHVVSRDIGGGALEIQHRASQSDTTPNQSPHREYYEFHQKSACALPIIKAIRKQFRNSNVTLILEARICFCFSRRSAID